MIADTSGLLAYFNSKEPKHRSVVAAVEETETSLVVSPYVIAELDYLVATRHGVEAELVVLEELGNGAWILPNFVEVDVRLSLEVVRRYRDLGIGVADASLVVLAERFNTTRILTLDHRHFEVIRPLSADRFTIVPGR